LTIKKRAASQAQSGHNTTTDKPAISRTRRRRADFALDDGSVFGADLVGRIVKVLIRSVAIPGQFVLWRSQLARVIRGRDARAAFRLITTRLSQQLVIQLKRVLQVTITGKLFRDD
jgi:hypothetical protein